MKSTANNAQDITVVFYAPRAGSKAHKLADVSLEFNRGLLRGLKLTGFSVWLGERAEGGEVVCVTTPSREMDKREQDANRNFYEFLHGDTRRLKAVIKKQYELWASAKESDAGEAQDSQERVA